MVIHRLGNVYHDRFPRFVKQCIGIPGLDKPLLVVMAKAKSFRFLNAGKIKGNDGRGGRCMV